MPPKICALGRFKQRVCESIILEENTIPRQPWRWVLWISTGLDSQHIHHQVPVIPDKVGRVVSQPAFLCIVSSKHECDHGERHGAALRNHGVQVLLGLPANGQAPVRKLSTPSIRLTEMCIRRGLSRGRKSIALGSKRTSQSRSW